MAEFGAVYGTASKPKAPKKTASAMPNPYQAAAPAPAAPAMPFPVPVQQTAATPTGSFTNTAAANPTTQKATDALMARAEGDMGAGKALDRGFQKIRANASHGVAGEMAANRARMGSEGSSANSFDARELAQNQEAAFNSLETDVAIGLERDRNSVLQSVGQMGLAQGAQQTADNESAYNMWLGQRNLAMQQRRDDYASLRSTMDFLRDTGDGAVAGYF